MLRLLVLATALVGDGLGKRQIDRSAVDADLWCVVALSQRVHLGMDCLFWYAETAEHLDDACDEAL